MNTSSVMSLHFRYRLWIAEMNHDIDILKIFDDYLQELAHKIQEPEIKSGIEHFENEFIASRKEIDELRHEMHMLKMKLAAYAREGIHLDTKNYQADHHTILKKRYLGFRKLFDKLKTAFGDFERKWLT